VLTAVYLKNKKASEKISLAFFMESLRIRGEELFVIHTKVSPIRRPAFFEAEKRRQKTPFSLCS